MNKTFFTADEHYHHLNKKGTGIIDYEPKRLTLFDNIEHMNDVLITNHNKIVSPEDIVYHLGDFCFGNAQKAASVLKKLNGKHYIIKGNHDNGVNSLKGSGFIEAHKQTIICPQNTFTIYLTHDPLKVSLKDYSVPGYYLVLCGHVHSVWKKKVINDTLFINVGVDVWGYKPVPLSEILLNFIEML